MLPSEAESNPSTPNIEASPSPAPQPNVAGLDLRLRQQELLAELGVLSLQGKFLQELLDAAVRMAAEGLQAQLCKVLEYIPAENRLLMRAGVGWDPGLVGVASIGADLEIALGICIAHRQAGYLQPPGKRGALQDARAPSRAWGAAGHQRHPAGRRVALRGSGSGQSFGRRVHRARHFLSAGRRKRPRHGHRAPTVPEPLTGLPGTAENADQGDQSPGQEQPAAGQQYVPPSGTRIDRPGSHSGAAGGLRPGHRGGPGA